MPSPLLSAKNRKAAAPASDASATPEPAREQRGGEGRLVLNVKLLVITFVTLAVAAPTLYALHSFQVSRTADAFLDRAGELEQEGEMRLAANYVNRYRRLRPEEKEVVAELARTYDAAAQSPGAKRRATQFYYQAIGIAEGDRETALLRTRLAELLLEASPTDAALLVDAEEQAGLLSVDAEEELRRRCWRVVALARASRTLGGGFQTAPPAEPGTIGEEASEMSVAACLERARDLQPHDRELSLMLATAVYRSPERFDELLSESDGASEEGELAEQANAIMDEVVIRRRKRLVDELTSLGVVDDDVTDAALATLSRGTLNKLGLGEDAGQSDIEVSPEGEKLLAERAEREIRDRPPLWLLRTLRDELPPIANAIAANAPSAGLSDEQRGQLADWLLGHDQAAVKRHLLDPLRERNADYAQAILMRHEYGVEHGVPAPVGSLDIAIAHTPDQVQVLIQAGSSRLDLATDDVVDAEADAAHAREAERLLNRAIELDARNEYPHLLLGELMLRRADKLAADSGEIALAAGGSLAFESRGSSSLLLHFEGEDNDVRVTSLNSESPIQTATIVSGPGEAQAKLKKFGKLLEVSIPADGIEARELIGVLNDVEGVQASADSSIDAAIAAWRAGLRATRERSPGLALRIAEELTGAGQREAAEEALATLDEVIARIDDLGADLEVFRSRRSMLGARLAMTTDDTASGVAQLEQLLADATSEGDSAELRQVWTALAAAYTSAGEWGKAARAHEELAVLDPETSSHRENAGLGWSLAGNFARAAAQFRRAIAIDDTPELRLSLVRTVLEEQKQRLESSRDWEDFDKALAKLLESQSDDEIEDAWRVDIVRIDAAIAKAPASKRQLAQERMLSALRQVERKYKAATPLLRRLSSKYEELDSTDDVLRVLDLWYDATTDPAGKVEVALRRSSFEGGRGDYVAARRVLEEALLEAPGRIGKPLEEALLRLDFKAGDVGRAQEQLLAAHEADPGNADTIARLAELSISSGDLAEYRRWREKLVRLEGEDGVGVRLLDAQQLLAEVEDPEDPSFGEAEQLLRSVIAERPQLSTARWVLAQLAERRGDFDTAIEQYERLRSSGRVFGRLFEKLIAARCQSGTFEQAAKAMADAERRGFESEVLDGLKMLINAGVGRLDDAIAQARTSAAANPDDPAFVFRYATLLASSRDKEQLELAVKAFKRCVELAPDQLDFWRALVLATARVGDRDGARKLLESVAGRFDSGDTVGLSAMLSVGYQAIGDMEEATRLCRIAADENPDESSHQLRLAQLVRDSDPEEAESLVRAVLDRDPEYRPARQFLAVLLNEREDNASRQEALALLEQSDGSDANVEDLRLKARLLIERGGAKQRRAARHAVEAIASVAGELSDGDRATLAALYESEGRYRDARREYTTLASRDKPNPTHLAQFSRMLIRRQDFRTADRWLTRLQELAPDATATTELRAYYFVQRDQTDEAATLIRDYVERMKQNEAVQVAPLMRWAGNVCTQFKLHEQAEPYYREQYRLEPAAYRALATCLANQQRVDEALDLCLDAVDRKDSPAAAIAIAAVLLTGKGTTEHYERAEPALAEAERRFADSVELRLMLANMNIVIGKPGEAKRLYRVILKSDGANLLALNNLAALLAEEPDTRDEALTLIDRALIEAERRGAQPAIEALLTDTKGSALLYRGQHEEALELLITATQLGPTEPIYQLHLAAAYKRSGDDDEASKVLNQARALGLGNLELSRVDRDLLRELERRDVSADPQDISSRNRQESAT